MTSIQLKKGRDLFKSNSPLTLYFEKDGFITVLCEMREKFGRPSSEVDEEANKILRAYNHYDELLTALADLLEYTGGSDISDAEHPILKARAAISKAEAPMKTHNRRGWQPIETAPKDGTAFIAYSEMHGIHHNVKWGKCNRFDPDGYSSLMSNWVLWMPKEPLIESGRRELERQK